MSDDKTYHHGDLRAALLKAAEEELTASGLDAFSLRKVAKRVGVSHAAPAHHFKDASGLLSALAAEGFERFRLAMEARQAQAAGTPRDRAIASALGYVDFALGAPALFRLMFGSNRVDDGNPLLHQRAEASFLHLVDNVTALHGAPALDSRAGYTDVIAQWSLVHGFAELLISGKMRPVQEMTPEAREAFLRGIFERLL